MPAPKTHYRIALGEHKGQHSWLIHSAKGVKWHNIPDELVTLLQKISVNELVDFALGSEGRWYVKYRQRGFDRQELSADLWMELGQGSNVKLDRLTLGPGAHHWGVHRTAGGSFQRFSSVGNRGAFTRLLDSKTQNIKSNNQIGFVSLGFNGDWAFSVSFHVEHGCGKPFHNELVGGWRARKRVSTIVLSPMARVWIIVWEDGTLSHNLPFNIANDVKDYCQLQHSLKSNLEQRNSGRSKATQAVHPRNNQSGTGSSNQRQQSATNPTETGNWRSRHDNARNTRRPPSTQRMTNNRLNVAPIPVSTLTAKPLPIKTMPIPEGSIAETSTSIQRPPVTKPAPTRLRTSTPVRKAPSIVKPVEATMSTTQPKSQIPLTRVKALSAKPTVYVHPKRLSTTLRLLSSSSWPDSAEYEKVVRLFEDGWKHDHKARPTIKRIFVVTLPDHLNYSYEEYNDTLERRHGWRGANEQLVFHGTERICSLGEKNEYSYLCYRTTCRLCCILQTSFLVTKAGSAGRSFKRFGPGIYTSSVSSKADDYAISPWTSGDKAMIVAKVALGKISIHYKTTQHLTAPPQGYDSVLGDVGIDLNYDEQVSYKNEAVRPAYVVIYERPMVTGTATFTMPRSAAQTTLFNTAATLMTKAAPATTTINSSTSGSCIIM